MITEKGKEQLKTLKKSNVQVQMIDRTLNKINKMKDSLKTDNRSEIVKMSVDIADMVAGTLRNGGHVIMEDKHGKQQKIVIPGLYD